ncbi:MAG TPA: YCF48-related protein [Flavobacteriales bacterium]|nr:YCF48-related protein [Flavobacteriales bacterium]
MKTLINSLLLVATMVPFNSKAQWTTLNSPTNLALDRAAFPDDATGFVANSTAKKIFRTTDGGVTWDSIAFTNNVLDIDFINPDTGFVIIGAGGTSYELKTTFDKGNTWTTKTITTSGVYLQRVFFTSALVGYVVDYDATVQKTIDGGTTWAASFIGSYAIITDKERIDQDTVIMTGWDGTFAYKGAIYRTDNAGGSWQAVIHDSSYTMYTGTHFLNGMHGYAVYPNWSGSNTVMAKTLDGGVTWSIQTTANTGNFQDVFMVNPTRGYIAKEDTVSSLLFSNDGINFTVDYLPAYTVRKFFSNGNAIWGIGDGGIIVKNATGNGVVETLQVESVNVFPNPTTGEVYFNFGKPAHVTLSDINGKEILNAKTFPGQKVDMGHLPGGIYVAKINVEGKIGHAKIVLNR